MKYIVKRDKWTLRELQSEMDAWDEAVKLSKTNPTMTYHVIRVEFVI